MRERLRELRKHFEMTQADFAAKLGMAQNSYSAIEVGKNNLTDKNITIVCLAFGVNESWLRDGQGEMMNQDAQSMETESRLFGFFRQLSPRAQEMVIQYVDMLLANEKELRSKETSEEKRAGSA